MKRIMNQSLLLSLFFLVHFLLTTSAGLVKGGYEYKGVSKRKLFVFGDSYADTGNWNNSAAISWKTPYGITFPGKPSGRFSDGRILTDYIASYMHIPSPTPYERRNKSRGGGSSNLEFGVNFAYGGTGVFDTGISQPNMSSQIKLFENIITRSNIYTKSDLQSSVALVSVAGNDYANYLKSGSHLSLEEFTKSVVNQMVVDLQQIHNLGVPKILVTEMQPLGCLPVITSFSGYKDCSEGLNNVTLVHNELLHKSIQGLSNNSKQHDVFFVLDLYGAFLSVLQDHKSNPGNSKYSKYGQNLRPCCEGITGDFGCGSKDGDRTKYTVCEKPNLAVFWDTVHPTQNGWYQVYCVIEPTLRSFFG